MADPMELRNSLREYIDDSLYYYWCSIHGVPTGDRFSKWFYASDGPYDLLEKLIEKMEDAE